MDSPQRSSNSQTKLLFEAKSTGRKLTENRIKLNSVFQIYYFPRNMQNLTMQPFLTHKNKSFLALTVLQLV